MADIYKYKLQGRYDEAVFLYKRSLMITKNLMGSDHLDTVGILYQLAEIYCFQGRYSDEEFTLQELLSVRKKQLGYDHIDTANAYYYLSTSYLEQKKWTEAEESLNKAVITYRKILGSQNPQFQAAEISLKACSIQKILNCDQNTILSIIQLFVQREGSPILSQ